MSPRDDSPTDADGRVGGLGGIRARRAIDWRPPDDWVRVTAIDAHTAGEPFRVIVDGVPALRGDTLLERRRYARQHLDWVRTALMWEPRGHADMYGCLITDPVTEGADLGVLFLHNEGYSTMCGHGIIGLVTVVLETGMLPARGPETAVCIDTPAGPVSAVARLAEPAAARNAGPPSAPMRHQRVREVSFRNVPSFVVALDEAVEVPGLGRVRYDLAFGGAFYAYVEAAEVGLTCAAEEFRDLIDVGMRIKRAVMASRRIEHPFEADLGFLYGTILVAPPAGDGVHSRNVCVFAEGEVDRSPTGTGVSGRLAVHDARGELEAGESIVVESLIGSRFSGRIVDRTRFGPYDAVVPEVTGSAHIVGRNELLIDPADPLRGGFLLR